MAIIVRDLYARSSTGESSVTINLGQETFFLAWGTVSVIDSLSDFDRDNAVVLDIPFVNGVFQPRRLFGGDHFGPEELVDGHGHIRNVFPAAVVRFGRSVTFRLRAFHSDDLACLAYCTVMTNISP
jgi:hypothetical protein